MLKHDYQQINIKEEFPNNHLTQPIYTYSSDLNNNHNNSMSINSNINNNINYKVIKNNYITIFRLPSM